VKYAFLLLLVALTFQLPAFADDSDGIAKFIRIPVFFVCDRARTDQGKDKANIQFGRERQYDAGLCKHDPYLGIAWCVIKNTENKPECVSWKALGWETSTRRTEGPDGAGLTPGSDYQDKTKTFYDTVYERANKLKEREVYMFVPGYMSTFESGLRSAARLAYYSERPMLLYSWPSKGKFTEYFADEATVEWSQEHFDDILRNVGKISQRDPAVHARIYAHSMGGRFVLRSIPVLKSTNAIREVSVICPDVDDGVVKHYASKYFDGKQQIIVRLYESKRDEMLKFSQLVHGGYKRFGEERTPLDSLLPKGSVANLGAGAISDLDETSEADCAMTKMLRRMQTIDYTDIDVGTLGHRIPVELLASLSQHGCPGKGLKMCVAHPVKQPVATASVTDDRVPAGTASAAEAKAPSTEGGHKAEVARNYQASDSSDGVIKIEHLNHRMRVPVIGTLIKYRPRVRLLLTKDWSLK
jgi:hypothetical protein